KLANGHADYRCAAQTATDINAEAHFALLIELDLQANVVNLYGRTIFFGASYGDFEFAWQKGEFGVEARPLANNLAVRAGVHDFVRGDARKLVRRGIADAVTAGLGAVHTDISEFRQNVRHFSQSGPVKLNVLASADVAITL